MSADSPVAAAMLEFDHGTCANCGGFIYHGPFLTYEPDLDEHSDRHIWRHRTGYAACGTMAVAFATPTISGTEPGKHGPEFVIDAGGRQNGKTTRALKRLEEDALAILVVPDESQRRHVMSVARKQLDADEGDLQNLLGRIFTVDAVTRSQVTRGRYFRRAIVDEGQHLVRRLLNQALGVPVSYLAMHAEPVAREVPRTRPVVTTLCGSTRFRDEFFAVQRELTLAGRIVISVGLFGHLEGVDIGTAEEPSEVKVMLDELHKRKIDISDGVYVVNPGGYIGSSTRGEIDYAVAHGKTVEYLEAI